MARKPRNTASKARSARKAPARAASKRAAPKKAASRKGASKRAAGKRTAQKGSARAQSRRRASASPDWATAIDTLIGSPQGRGILASVLGAAAEALRRQGAGLEQTVETGTQQMVETGEAAAEIGREVVAGSMALAQTAAGVLAGVATEAATSLLTEAGSETTGKDQRRRGKEGASSE